MYRLVISDDAGKTTVVTLVRDEITLGRADDNHICLTERNVSRHHARLVRRAGGYTVEDLSSYNGVKLNGARIEQAADLSPGDRVSIGDYQLRFESDAATGTSSEDEVDVEIPLPARLVMLTPPAAGAEFSLARLPGRLGRSEEIDLTVNHRSISREHAEFSEIDGAIVVRDLDSANGVRVNGEDVGEATLEDGDTLELGQVRFRFVAAGVEYAYDPDAPDVADVEADDDDSRQRTPIIAAVLIIVVAVAAATAIAVKGARDARVRASQPAATTAPTAEDRARELAAAIADCQSAAEAERWEDALRHAERAVAIDPSASAAHDCRANANAGANAVSIATQAVALFGEGEVVRAYRELEAIPAGNDALAREDVVAIARAYATLKSGEANDALTRGDAPAASLAATEAVAAVHSFALEDLQPDAEALLTQAQERAGNAPAQADEDAAEAQPVAAAAIPAGDLSAAQACLEQNDVDCVLVATEGNGTVQALEMRFRALRRAAGRRAEAVRAARLIVQRFPSSQAATRAREYLEP